MSRGSEGHQLPTSLRDMSKHWAVYGLGSLLNRLAGFLMLPVYTRFLTPTEYGIRAMVTASVDIAALFLAMGIPLAVLRYYWDDDQRPQPVVVSTGLVAATALAAFGIGLALWFARPLAALVFGGTEYTVYLRLGLVAMFFGYILNVPMALLQVTKQSLMFTAVSVATLLVSIILNVFFVVFLQAGVTGILYADVITNALFCLLLTGLALRAVGCSVSWPVFRTMLRYGAPTLFVASGWLVIKTADRLLLTRLASLAEVGLYSLANSFAQVLLVVLIQPFLTAWGPAQFEVSRQPNAAQLFRRLFHLFTSTLIVVAFTMSLFIDDVVRILMPPPFWPAATLVPLLVLSYVLMGVHTPFNTGILITKRTEWAGLILLVTAGLNVFLNFLFIPSYLALGAAASRVASLLGLLALTYVVSQRLYAIDFKILHSMKTLAYALGLFALSRYLAPESLLLALPLKAALGLVLCGLVLRSEMLTAADRERLTSVARGLLARFSLALARGVRRA